MRRLFTGTVVVAMLVAAGPSVAQDAPSPFVRIAEISVDPTHLDAYRAAVKEEIEQSVRTEPGVIAIYAVAEKDHPAQFHLLEIYRDKAGYDRHIQSPQFLKYKAATKDMVRSLKLLDTVPLTLMDKSR
jgi:quinol monooxygenase YgiN